MLEKVTEESTRDKKDTRESSRDSKATVESTEGIKVTGDKNSLEKTTVKITDNDLFDSREEVCTFKLKIDNYDKVLYIQEWID